MNTRAKATQDILSFLQSKERVLLLTGTYQNRKHILALSLVFSHYPSPAKILFRANHLRNIKSFLSPVLKLNRTPKTGVPYNVKRRYELYVDDSSIVLSVVMLNNTFEEKSLTRTNRTMNESTDHAYNA